MGFREIQAVRDQIASRISDGHWTVLATGAPDRPTHMSYTIGLAALGHPEAVIFGLPGPSAQGILNAYGKALLAGGDFAPDATTGILANMPLLCVAGDPELALSYCPLMGLPENAHPDKPLQALHLVWPDPRGFYPLDPRSDPTCREAQLPLLSGATYH